MLEMLKNGVMIAVVYINVFMAKLSNIKDGFGK